MTFNLLFAALIVFVCFLAIVWGPPLVFFIIDKRKQKKCGYFICDQKHAKCRFRANNVCLSQNRNCSVGTLSTDEYLKILERKRGVSDESIMEGME